MVELGEQGYQNVPGLTQQRFEERSRLVGDLSMAARVHPLSSGGSASRRRERRLRSFWRHEQLSVKMMAASMSHHSFQYRASTRRSD